jgi:hypothetical protein
VTLMDCWFAGCVQSEEPVSRGLEWVDLPDEGQWHTVSNISQVHVTKYSISMTAKQLKWHSKRNEEKSSNVLCNTIYQMW